MALSALLSADMIVPTVNEESMEEDNQECVDESVEGQSGEQSGGFVSLSLATTTPSSTTSNTTSYAISNAITSTTSASSLPSLIISERHGEKNKSIEEIAIASTVAATRKRLSSQGLGPLLVETIRQYPSSRQVCTQQID